MKFKCDDCKKVEVDVGGSNPSLVLCANCNGGHEQWNCVDVGNHSCDCSECEGDRMFVDWYCH
jgi:hypothetical protein